jgi:hypothetical protein
LGGREGKGTYIKLYNTYIHTRSNLTSSIVL